MKYFDYSKLKEKKWPKDIVNYIGLIHEYKGRHDLYFALYNRDDLKDMVELAKKQSVEGSSDIDNIRTSESRLRQLMAGKTKPSNYDEQQLLGYRNVLNMIHDSYDYIPLTPNFILKFHKVMNQYSDGADGKYKDKPNEITNTHSKVAKKIIFKTLDPFETPYAIESLCDQYHRASKQFGIDSLLLIPIFIHDFLCIHPFDKGNGRISRILASLLLFKAGYMIGKYISIEKKMQKTMEEYFDALSDSSKGWHENKQDEAEFIKYFLLVVLSAYRDFDERVSMVPKKRLAKEIVINAVSKQLDKFTKKEIMELCPEIKSSSVEISLRQLCEEGLIEKHGGGRSTYYSWRK